ncbi:MAG: hypothetical protein DYG90_00365 [Chloroflexi bacterium CFX6]|nr:hypothetical protein [Chloroflexi bacterium CFX6]
MAETTTEARRQIVAGLVRQRVDVPLAAVRRAVLAAGHQASDNTLRKDVALVRGELEQEQIERRQELVATFMARKLTHREMLRVLAGAGFDVSRRTLERDVQAVKRLRLDLLTASVEEWTAQEVAELEEMERQAAQKEDLGLRLKIKVRKHAVLGIDKPAKIAPTTPDGEAPYDPFHLSDEEAAARIAALLDAARTRRGKRPARSTEPEAPDGR